MARIEDLVGRLESGMPGLDEAIAMYEACMGSIKACQKRLAEAEGRIRTLMESGGEPVLREFEPDTAAPAEAGGASPESAATEEEKPRPRRRRSSGTGLF
jgi:exodeoxyribonuclease VII small subunit